MSSIWLQIRAFLQRHLAVTLWFVLGVAVVLAAEWYAKQPRTVEQPPVVANVTESATSTPLSLPASLPVHISMPTAKIEADFEAPLGIQPSGEIDAPKTFTHVAYYKNGPTPGQIGPAVVLGHVDSYKGPAVFYYLGQLKPGDPVYITRADGSIATFTVDKLEREPQSQFPTKAVYGDIPYAGLRLITCTGIYDHGIQRYSHNLIVFAHLTATSSATSTTATTSSVTE